VVKMNLKSILILVILVAATSIAAQETAPVSQLFDTIGKSNGEVRSMTFDGLFMQLQNIPNSTAYVFVYCGKVCKYGEVESHIRGIELKIDSRKFHRSQIVILNGGFREKQEVEIWTQPIGADPPFPRSTLNIKNVTFSKSNAALIEPYDCCGSLTTQWKTFTPTK